MASTVSVYLDVETDWSRRLTVIGFRSSQTGLVQLVGSDITRTRLLRHLPNGGRLFTYNGHCFDLPCVRDQLGIDLRERFESVDLRWVCQRHRLRGGQKAVESELGVGRRVPGLCGLDAIYLFERWKLGDSNALTTLLQYNADDIAGLVAIRRHLSSLGAFRQLRAATAGGV